MKTTALLALGTLAACTANMDVGDKPSQQQGSSEDTGNVSADDGATVTSATTDDGGAESTGGEVVADCELLGPGPAADPRYQWTLHCGGPAIEDLAGIAVDDDGTTYVAFDFFMFEVDGPASLRIGDDVYANEGRGDLMLLAIDDAGSVLWSRHVGGASDLEPRSLVRCGDQLVVTGDNMSDGVPADFGTGTDEPGAGFVAAFATDGGATQWAHSFGLYPQQPTSRTACGPSGEIAVFGELSGAIELAGAALESAGWFDGYVVVLEPDGSLRWSTTFGDADQAQATTAAAFDGDGRLVIAARIAGSTDFGGGSLAAAGTDAVIVAYEPDGTFAWHHQAMGSGSEMATRLVVDAAGTITVLGGFDIDIDLGGGVIDDEDTILPGDDPSNPPPPVQDLFVAALDGTGAHQWSIRVGADGWDFPLALSLDPSAAPIVSYFTAAGTFEVASSAGGVVVPELSLVPSVQTADLAIDASGALVIGASGSYEIDLGSGPIVDRGNGDIVVARYSP